jgi:hypothetical protein
MDGRGGGDQTATACRWQGQAVQIKLRMIANRAGERVKNGEKKLFLKTV